MSSQKVGPTISDDIKKDAVLSVFFALMIIFLYIAVRFRNWQFGLGGLASLAHDVIIVIGLYSLLDGWLSFSLAVDMSFIAAVLTIIGYSINDTVIVFDRIREYVHLHPKQDTMKTYNDAMNSTLRRTFSTSLTVLVVLFAIFLFGGIAIKGFVFALLFGIIFGTYSSVFVATPIAYDILMRRQKNLTKRNNEVFIKKPGTRNSGFFFSFTKFVKSNQFVRIVIFASVFLCHILCFFQWR